MEIKTKTNGTYLNSLHLNLLCTVKETIKKMKRQPTGWKKIFADDVTNKGLVPKIYKQLMILSSIKTNNTINKITEDINRYFSKKIFRWSRGTWKWKCSTLLFIREIWIKTTMKYHLIPARMATIQKCTNNKCWRRCGQKGTLLLC